MRRIPRYYSDVFKRRVVSEVRSGAISKEGARRKYGIRGKSAILYWMQKFDGIEVDYDKGEMPKIPMDELEELKQLSIENQQLKEDLKKASLRSEAYNLMIQIAENEYGIPIRKKYGSKQLKR